ncbi:hypothetical protein [Clostridium sp.]|jgi:hypothetical protein|uniref:hypothetical protein n=1 Tax=Clostridium sp. TaxID=1506 RepID=UPI003EEFE001
MAQRRMFSMKIINSARFLKMPVSSQLLYFHLGLQADDDGVVEAYNTLRMTNCTEDDLKILVAKDLVIVLNEDLVSFITDWKEHNLIRPDRKINSIYKGLLLKIVPDVDLVTKRARTDLKKMIEAPMDGQRTDNGQAMDGIGKVRLGKVSLKIEKTFLSDSDEYRLSSYLWNYIKKNNEQAKKPNMQKWSKGFDSILRIDSRTIDDIKKVIVFSQKNEFWYKNILSPDKLRKHYEKLTLQMKEPKYEKGKGKFVDNCIQRDTNYDELEKKLLGDKTEAVETKVGINLADYYE